MDRLKKFLKEFDMFPAPALLRVRQDPEVSSVCAGTVSLLLIIFFTYVFVASFKNTIEHQEIEYSVSDEKLSLTGNQFESTQLMFGIRMDNQSLANTQKLFFFSITDSQKTFDPLEPCTPTHWQSLGSDYEEQFTRHQLYEYLCTPKGLPMKNTEHQEGYVHQLLQVYICDTNSTAQCLAVADALALMQSLIDPLNFVVFKTVILDTGFTPSNTNSTLKFINNDLIFTVSNTSAAWITIDFPRYVIETDQTILPFEQIKTEEGIFLGFINTEKFVFSFTLAAAYVDFRLRLKQKTIKRVVGKFDELLSYAGGLFSIMIGFLAFFIASFNEYRYEILLAQGAFTYDQKGKKIKESDFNFLFYIKYSLFDWMNALFSLELQLESCKEVDETREELNKQIDVTLLLKRLQHLERCISYMMKAEERKAMYLYRHEHLDEIRDNRMYLEYYEWIVQGKESLTAQDVSIAQDIASFTNLIRPNNDKQANQQDRLQQTIDLAMNKFPQIKSEAEQIVLTESQLIIENQIAQAFRNIPPQLRQTMQMKIPLKILHRIRQTNITMKTLPFEDNTQSFVQM